MAAAGTRRRRFPVTLPLTNVATAVAEAYTALGELEATEVAWQQRAGGYVRCLLPEGTPEENLRFTVALAEAVEPAVSHRYVISRPVGDGWRYGRAWHPVPSDFGRNRERADTYAAAFARWLGPGELRYTVTDAEALAPAAGGDAAWETQTRQLWR